MIQHLLRLLLLGVANPLTAQTPSKPVKIEEKTVITHTYSSKHGIQKHVRHDTYILYDDGTRTAATARKLKPIAFETTLGAYKWHKWQQSTQRQWVGLPLIVTGIVGVVVATEPAKRTHGALIGSIGLASGVWTISHFEFQKRKYLRRLIDFCNDQLHSQKTFDAPQPVQPDVLKIGFQSNDNSLGIGLNWTF